MASRWSSELSLSLFRKTGGGEMLYFSMYPFRSVSHCDSISSPSCLFVGSETIACSVLPLLVCGSSGFWVVFCVPGLPCETTCRDLSIAPMSAKASPGIELAYTAEVRLLTSSASAPVAALARPGFCACRLVSSLARSRGPCYFS